MPHVSKHALHQEVLIKISSLLLDTLSKKGFSKDRKYYLRELLTRTEQIMLAKRVAMIFFICQGDSTYTIRQRLKVSPSTIAIMKQEVESGKYAKLCNLFRNDTASITETIEKILSAGMPPIAGKGRWKFLDK